MKEFQCILKFFKNCSIRPFGWEKPPYVVAIDNWLDSSRIEDTMNRISI